MRPLLANYKAWIGNEKNGWSFIGMGPGRSKCDVPSESGLQSPALCPNGIETIFDSYDVTSQVNTCIDGPCEVFIEGYGYDQPGDATLPPVIRRVVAELALVMRNGTVVFPLQDIKVSSKLSP